jgi:Tol biopolymer transport system component
MNPDGTGRTQITTTPDVTEFGRWSPDGTKIVFRRFDFTTSPPGPWQVWTMNADGSNQTNVTPDVSGPPFYDARVQPTGIAWSPDGTKIAITNEDGCAPGHSPGQLILIDPDGSNPEQVVCRWPYVPPGTIKGAAGASPNWSPDGNKLTVSGPHSLGCQADTWTVNRDGTNLTDITQGNSGDEAATDWSPDGARIATFEAGDCADSVPPTMWTMKTDGTDRTAVPIASAIRWTPDNTKFAFTDQGDIWTANLNGTGRVNLTNTPGVSEFISDWLAVPNNAYARPRGATPARVSLVTAYNQCTSSDRTHGPPLAFPSCSSPQKSSSQLTVGTADANGKPALNEGYLALAAQAGAPGGVDDSDVMLDFFLDDVFTNALADYTGNLRVHLSLQITDRLNTPAPGGVSSATSVAIPVDMTVPCVTVPDPNEGSTCTANTSVDALIPGAVPEGRRAIWQLGAVQVYDAADALFATQGMFIP